MGLSIGLASNYFRKRFDEFLQNQMQALNFCFFWFKPKEESLPMKIAIECLAKTENEQTIRIIVKETIITFTHLRFCVDLQMKY